MRLTFLFLSAMLVLVVGCAPPASDTTETSLSNPTVHPTVEPSPTPSSRMKLPPVVTATPISQGMDIDWEQVEIISTVGKRLGFSKDYDYIEITYSYRDIDKAFVIVPANKYTEEAVKEAIAESIYHQTDFLTPTRR